MKVINRSIFLQTCIYPTKTCFTPSEKLEHLRNNFNQQDYEELSSLDHCKNINE